MTIKDYRIESSIDGKTWDTVYTGVIPNTKLYNAVCEFNQTICKYIRLVQVSTYDTRGYKWIQGGHFSIYVASLSQVYTNQGDAYVIAQEGEN